MKRFLSMVIACLILVSMVSLAGCRSESEANVSSSVETQGSTGILSEETDTSAETSSADVKSDGYEKFSQLKIGMTESEVNAVLGEPTSVDKAYYYYTIVVNGQDLELNVWISTVSGLTTNIYGDFSNEKYRPEFADTETDLSLVSGLKSAEIDTYDACVAAFKTPGYLTSIDEDGLKDYLWANINDGYITVTIRADGSVKTYQGVC